MWQRSRQRNPPANGRVLYVNIVRTHLANNREDVWLLPQDHVASTVQIMLRLQRTVCRRVKITARSVDAPSILGELVATLVVDLSAAPMAEPLRLPAGP